MYRPHLVKNGLGGLSIDETAGGAQALILCRLWPAAAAAVQTLRPGCDADYLAAQLLWRSGDLSAAEEKLRDSADARGDRPAKCCELLAMLEPWQDLNRQGSEAVADGGSGGMTVLICYKGPHGCHISISADFRAATLCARNTCFVPQYQVHRCDLPRPALPMAAKADRGVLILRRQTGSRKVWRHAPRCCAPSRSAPPAAWQRCSCAGVPRRCAQYGARQTPWRTWTRPRDCSLGTRRHCCSGRRHVAGVV